MFFLFYLCFGKNIRFYYEVVRFLIGLESHFVEKNFHYLITYIHIQGVIRLPSVRNTLKTPKASKILLYMKHLTTQSTYLKYFQNGRTSESTES